MLKFIAGLVLGGGSITAVYRLHIIPKWKTAVAAAENRYLALWNRFKAQV